MAVLLVAFAAMLYLFQSCQLKFQEGMPCLLRWAWSVLFACLSAALFTHLWEKLVYQWVLLAMFSIILYYRFVKGNKLLQKPFFWTVPVLILLLVFSEYADKWIHHTSYQTWKQAEKYCFSGYMNEGLALFAEAYPNLKRDVRYVLEACDAGGIDVPFDMSIVYMPTTPNSPPVPVYAYTPAGMGMAMRDEMSNGNTTVNTANNVKVPMSKGPCG